ncbi:MAG: DUF4190 domain-containing protein [Eggerthellaceae bacterium]|jgi:hypothetical protein|nr:DUF4190 domain-containing protein [Eggerthellaceae bacterium]MDR2715203.1 DUF4190 domain-containing protein [Coriobacteriaceae bacterium]
MSDSNPVAGWYADPEPGSTKLRYWDGAQWTDQLTEFPAAQAAEAAAAGAQPVVEAAVPQAPDAAAQPVSLDPNYGQPGYMQPAPAAVPQKNGKAVASLVCGILGLFLFGLILGIVAIVLGVQARKRPDRRGIAMAGIIFGVLALLGWAAGLGLFFLNPDLYTQALSTITNGLV